LLPFIIFAGIEAVVLTLIYLAPQAPFNAVLAPPIKTFKGEMFLHYPANFLIIPELSSFFRSILTVLIGSLLAGSAALMIAQVFQKKTVVFASSFAESAKKYFQLFVIILLAVVILHYSYKGFRKPGLLPLFINVIIMLVVQALFVYAVPFLIIGKEKLFKAIWRSIVFFSRNIWQTLLIVTLPFLFYIPIIILQYNTAYLIDNVFPESVLAVAYLSIVISSLIVDVLVTVSATLYYLNNKEG
jgi:hypothetical protein